MVESVLSLPLLDTSAFMLMWARVYHAKLKKQSPRVLSVRSFPPCAHSAAFEVIGKFGEGNRVLGIRRDFAHEYRALHRFFVSHDEDIRHGERAGRRHLLGDALVPETLMYGDGGAAEIFEHSEHAAARFAAQVRKIDGGLRLAPQRPIFALHASLSAHFAGD